MAKTIPLTRGAVALVDDDDYDLLISIGKWHLSDTGYAVIRRKLNGNYKTIRMHRVVNKTPIDKITDHLNNNRLDNRKANLRSATHKQNAQNRRVKGYTWDSYKGKWIVRYRNTFYGRYETEVEAQRAYQLACSGVPYEKKTRRQKYYLPTGVFKNRSSKGYQAKAQINGERVYLGTFATIEEAEEAYLDRKRG